MEDRLLVEALRSQDPAAIGAVYDDHADRLYGYCWLQLRSRDLARIAFRDTLMCAEAHVARLRDPTRFRAWLYALARIECRRRRPSALPQPDIPVARHDQDDVDLRMMVWQAVTALPPLSRELLDLRYHHDLAEHDIALVLDLPAKEMTGLLVQARVLLEAALIGEILAHDGPFGCPRRAVILRRRAGEIDDDLREALVRHSFDCPACARRLPDAVAPAKVYALLPPVVPPPELRGQVTSCFTDPEEAGYRLFAAARVSRFGSQGFPEQPGTGRPVTRGAHRWRRGLAAVGSALLAAVVATAVCRWGGQDTPGGTQRILAGPTEDRLRVPSPAPAKPPDVTHPIATTLPVGMGPSAAPVIAAGGPVPYVPLRAPGPGPVQVEPARLMLAPGDTGTITMRAASSGVNWWTAAAGPLRLTPDSGHLDPGGVQTIAVRVPHNGHGAATITFMPGGVRVPVSWDGPPGSPSTPPSTSPPSPPPSSPPTSPPSSPPPSSPPPQTPAPDPTTPAPDPTSPPPAPAPSPATSPVRPAGGPTDAGGSHGGPGGSDAAPGSPPSRTPQSAPAPARQWSPAPASSG